MKKLSYFLMLMLGIFSLSFVSCDNDDDEPITETQLPQVAKTFVQQYYSNTMVAGVSLDKEDGRMEYDVVFANGHKVTFDSTGEWIDVDAPTGQTIPDGIAPAKISDYVATNYSGYGINEISKEKYGYDVDLTSGVDLVFNADGDFVRIDR